MRSTRGNHFIEKLKRWHEESTSFSSVSIEAVRNVDQESEKVFNQ